MWDLISKTNIILSVIRISILSEMNDCEGVEI